MGYFEIGDFGEASGRLALVLSDAFERRLARAFCEDPQPFRIFNSSDGLAARMRANEKGLVAVFIRKSRWSLNCETYDFLAIPSGLAERMASGCLLDPEDRQVRKVLLALRGKMTKHVGRKERFQLTDAETRRDIERQLRRISFGRA